jgi:hypothetical protein
MKILLLGELSGVHQELAEGLRGLGHEVVVAHSKQANPDFKSDIPFFRAPNDLTGPRVWIRDIISQLSHAPQLTGFDIVQIITPKFFNWKIHGAMLRFLKRHNKTLVVINTACTSDYHRRVAELAYRPCKECLKFDLKADACIYDRPDEVRAEHLAFELADAIVATHYEYAFALADTPFASKVVNIPLPIDLKRHRPTPMPPLGKVRIWYGETRFGFKGSAFILPALERLQAGPLGDQIEIVRTGRLAFDEYLACLDTLHIVIDQASSYGMGMNALYALARGRATLTGAEPETLEFIGVPPGDNPMINMCPDVEQITGALTRLIEGKAGLPELGERSAAYISKYHAASVIAGSYEELYESLLDQDSP